VAWPAEATRWADGDKILRERAKRIFIVAFQNPTIFQKELMWEAQTFQNWSHFAVSERSRMTGGTNQEEFWQRRESRRFNLAVRNSPQFSCCRRRVWIREMP